MAAVVAQHKDAPHDGAQKERVQWVGSPDAKGAYERILGSKIEIPRQQDQADRHEKIARKVVQGKLDVGLETMGRKLRFDFDQTRCNKINFFNCLC